MRSNILISTTRQWNPGDEFIMQGALNALRNAYGDCFNPIIFNRNPDIRAGGKKRNSSKTAKFTYNWDRIMSRGRGFLQENFSIGHFDNSFKDDMSGECISLALFAGSPEWYGRRLNPMYRYIEKNKIPTVFLGVGAGDSLPFEQAIPEVRRVLEKSSLITTRDHETEELLEFCKAVYLTCPAFLAANHNRLVTDVKKIGLIYATDHTLNGNKVSQEMHEYLLKLYPEIQSRYETGLVCHYIDEVEQAQKEFPGADIYYSYDSKEYADIYDHFDLVVGGRVHGIGMSASLGIPGLMIKHDDRSNTTDGFLAESIQQGTDPEFAINKILEMSADINKRSQKLIDHKSQVMDTYVRLLKKSNLPLGERR